jgi:hypothetical protein
MPTFGIGQRTDSTNMLTILIPDMKFTYNATIAGFIVAGTRFMKKPHSKIQIWRQDSSQPCAYYKIQPDIVVNRTTCASLRVSVVNRMIGFCILSLKSMAVSVQPGDFLGLEIPQTNDNSEIYFTSGGPENYVFRGALNSSVELTNNSDFKIVKQQPQIAFNLTSGIIIISHYFSIVIIIILL